MQVITTILTFSGVRKIGFKETLHLTQEYQTHYPQFYEPWRVDSGLDFGCCRGNGFIILADKAKASSATNTNGIAFIIPGKGHDTGMQS